MIAFVCIVPIFAVVNLAGRIGEALGSLVNTLLAGLLTEALGTVLVMFFWLAYLSDLAHPHW
jgi:hypothetical protein